LSKPKIRLEQVTVCYGNSRVKKPARTNGKKGAGSSNQDRTILSGIDLEIQAGEFVSILGHSGCGKSTLLKTIAGFRRPDAGHIWIDDKRVEGPQSRHVFIFQEGALFPWLTIVENVSLALREVKDHQERYLKAQEYLELVALEGVENHYPYMLSGGMRQRAEIARALAAQPDVLLMDEPFSGLDQLTRLHLREEILYLHVMLPHTTILFVTHDIDEALQLSNRLVILGEPPSQVKCCRTIHIPHPRSLATPELGELRSLIHHHLGVHSAL
jgi:ABC-type nitrate/sulfonate/bicarbonate transport system ATPase subunit